MATEKVSAIKVIMGYASQMTTDFALGNWQSPFLFLFNYFIFSIAAGLVVLLSLKISTRVITAYDGLK